MKITIFDGLKSLVDHQQSVKLLSTSIKTLRQAHTATFSKDRQMDRGLI
jgi:hypothetical protein